MITGEEGFARVRIDAVGPSTWFLGPTVRRRGLSRRL